MAAPNVTLAIEPFEDGSVLCLPLAPPTSDDAGNVLVAVVVSMLNNESLSLLATELVIDFPNHPGILPSTYPLAITIGPGAREDAHLGDPAGRGFVIFIPRPVPNLIRVRVRCAGFADATSATFPLRAHVSPVHGGAYVFPARASDLGPGEFWQGRGGSHGSGHGSQLFGHDMIVVAFDQTSGQWSGTLPGTNGSLNKHSRTYGKPIYAMADGEVVGFNNTIPDNVLPNPAPLPPNTPVEGSHFWIRHGTEVMLYAHLQKDSMVAQLLHVGAVVHQGDRLGLAGNSGNSSGPHLHIHAMKGTQPGGGPLRPIPFRRINVVERSAVSPPSDGPWVTVHNAGLPSVESLIKPDVGKESDKAPWERESERMMKVIWLTSLGLAILIATAAVLARILG
jgi:hypothetical protein